ncbi:MAG: HAMP domain-containing sensor histidine kinase [Elusimicrobiota bacterium]
MSIRHKLALILSLAVAVTAMAAAGVFLVIEDAALRSAEEEKIQLLMQNVRAMATESDLARDQLMLLDYLSFLAKDRPEVVSARVKFGTQWQEASGAKKEKEGEVQERARIEEVTISPGGGRPAITVSVSFAARELEKRLTDSRKTLAHDLGQACVVVLLLGILISIPLGRTLTRRLLVIESALAEVGAGRLERRLQVSGSDEIANLGKGVNKMMERLLELEDMKRTFIASVTHELRSPLFAIQSYVRLLLSDAAGLREEDRRQLARIQQNSARLAHFVTSLLNTAKIERGSMDFVPREGDLGRLVEDVVQFHQSKAEEEGKTLKLTLDATLPKLMFDPDLMTQVVTNLLSNAIKFTPRGGQVSVTVAHDEAAALCSIADTGVGIPAEVLPRLFRPFERVKNGMSAVGTGLGLSIVKSLVEMHGGKIGVESTPGKGSRFYFILPFDNKSLIANRRK